MIRHTQKKKESTEFYDQNNLKVIGGKTKLLLNTSTGLTVEPINDLHIVKGKLNLNLSAVSGGILYQTGTISLSQNKTKVVLSNIKINLSQSIIKAQVTLFNEKFVRGKDLGTFIMFDTTLINYRIGTNHVYVNVNLTLDSVGATTLNDVFETTSFTTGLAIGSAEIKAKVKRED